MTKIPATEIQALELQESGYLGDDPVYLAYSGGWRWESGNWTTEATDAQAADALLERVCELENELTDLRYRAQVGDALVLGLQAQELLTQLGTAQIEVIN